MRKLFSLAAIATCALVVLGCPKKKTDGDGADAALEAAAEAAAAESPPAQPEDAAAAPVTPAPVTAKNAADVARFAAETAVTDDEEKLAVAAPARTAPKSGSVVATVKPGSDVTKVAEYQGSYLVTFADPKDANAALMGWIGKEAFSAPVIRTDGGVKDAGVVSRDAGTSKALTCPMGMVAVILTKDPICRKKCTKDADCKGAAAGSCAPASTAAGGVTRVCTAE